MQRFSSSCLSMAVVVFLLFLAQNISAQTVNICDRTEQVRDEILRSIAHNNCATVTAVQLSRVVTLELAAMGIVSLKEFDFDNLHRLEELHLYSNQLTFLPEDLFDGLSRLKKLDLGRNRFTTLPESLFDGLSRLEELRLDSCNLTSLPENLFDGLFELELLDIGHNPFTTLPEDLFDGLRNLGTLVLEENSLTSLPEDLFDGLSSLWRLRLWGNTLTSLPEELFDGLSGLRFLFLHENSLTNLPAGLLDGLSSLELLSLYENSLYTLPENIFDSIQPVLEVYLQDNPINCLPQRILDLWDAGTIIIFFNGELRRCPEALSEVMLVLSPPAILESDGRSIVTARLSRPLRSAATITLSTVPNFPATTGDYDISSNITLRIPPGAMTSMGDVEITANNNDIYSGDKTVTVSGKATNILGLLGPSDVTLTILDDDNPVTLKIQSPLVREDAGMVRVPVEVTPAAPTELSVRYQTVDQTAEENKDYTPTQGFLQISPGSTMEFIDVEIIDDQITEPPEMFFVRLSEATNAEIDPDEAIVTIEDNDEYRLQVDNIEAVEGSMQLIFTVILDAPNPEQTIRVEYETINGTAMAPSDYIPQSGTLVFQPRSTKQEVTVALVDDDDVEGDENFILELFNPELAVLSNNVAIGTIIDDDEPPQVSIIPTLTVQEDAGQARFEVTLSHSPLGRTTSVEFVVNDESAEASMDYNLQTLSPLRFTSGQTKQYIEVEILDDELSEEEETFLVQLINAQNGELAQSEGQGIIVDNDDPLTVSIYDQSVSEGAGSVLLPVRLSQPSSEVVSVQFTSSDVTASAGADYTTSRGIVIFQRGSTEGKIHIQVLEDSEIESEETFQVTLSNPRNAVLAQEIGTGTILDNDGSPGVSIQSVIVSRSAAVFDVSLSMPSPFPVLVSYASEDGSAQAGEDYEPVVGQVTFVPGEVLKTVEVKLLPNEPVSKVKTFSLVLLSAVNADLQEVRTEAVIEEKNEENVQNAYVSRVLRTWASQVVEALSRRMEGMAQCRAPDLTWLHYGNGQRSLGEIFSGCGAQFTQGGWNVWGQGAFRRVSGRDGALSLRSDVTTILAGVDYVWSQGWIAGLLAAKSWDQGTYETPILSGTASSRLTGIYPYVSYQTGSEMRAWMLLGLGRGDAEIEALESGVDAALVAALVALGFTGTLTGGTTGRLGYELDAFWATADVENGSDLVIRRIRVGAEGSLRLGLGIQPYIEAALRQDGGDAETGIGIELGGGIRWSTSQLHAELGGRTLLLHMDEGMQEWGLMGTIEYGSPSGLGPSMRVRPLWGNMYGEDLWREVPLQSMGLRSTDQRVEMELGYGTPIKKSIGRSIVGMTLDPRGRAYRVGYHLRVKQGLQFSIASTGRTMEAKELLPHSYGLSAHMDLKW